MTPQKLDRRALTVWRVRLTLIMLIPSFLVSLFFSMDSLYWKIGTGIWVGVFATLFFWYYPLKYKKLSFYLNEESLVIGCGVFYTRVKSMPLCNIQYVTLGQTLLQRVLQVKSVFIVAAGGWVYLPGVEKETANRLQRILTSFPREEKTGESL